MREKMWKQVKRATQYEKIQMEQMAREETVCSFELFHKVFEDDVPYYFKVGMHSGYQLDAYRSDNDKIADSSYHMLVARCGVCGELITIDGDPDYAWCYECNTEYENGIAQI